MEFRINYKKYFLIIFAVFICCSASVIWMIYDKSSYKPPLFEPTAIKGVPELSDSEKKSFGYSPLSVAEGLSFYLSGRPKESEDSIELYLNNPNYNQVWILCKVLDENDNEIAESGIIKQGYFLKEIKKKNKTVAESKDLKIQLFCFEPYTYYCAAPTITFECTSVI